jgi:hypothetical protein
MDHILLHQYRWIIYGEKGDYLMFKGREGDTEEFRKVSNERRIEVTKSRGSGFWNPALQRELGRKGGSKGGSKNTPRQFQARQKVGLNHGRSSGTKRQSSALKSLLREPISLTHRSGLTIKVKLECAEDLRKELASFGQNLPKTSPAGMLLGGKPWGGWVVQGRAFDKRKNSKPVPWASVKGNLTKHGFRVGDISLYTPDREYRTCLSETFLEYCRLYGNPVGSRSSVSGTARD